MKALVISDIGKAEFTSVEPARPGPGDVVLKVRTVGLCGSDLNTFRGLNPLAKLPRIPGHEIGGTIVETGADVPADFAPGRSAIVVPYTSCGKCASCRKRRTNACQFNATLGVQRDGGMSERLVVPHEKLILNDRLPARHLSLVEPLSVGFHAVARGSVAAGDTVVVLGGGMIGVGAMLGAIQRGARVIAVEVSEAKRQLLLDFGVAAVVNPLRVDQLEAVRELTGGDGADVAIEAVGLPETFVAAVDMAGFAGRVVFVGYAKKDVSFNTSLFNLKELDMFGSRNATRADFGAVIGFVEANPAISDKLISRVFPWDEAEGSFEFWEANRNETLKVMVEFPDE
ncbi:zinc-binding alcohol dehydrogenase family protein [Tropicimonas sp.]|uniref:zinc-binding alcohol dehydrogenase family protein n=1 Tax=Tropicimonas sp. TaxID=2067044 RepID=UPI003A85773C